MAMIHEVLDGAGKVIGLVANSKLANDLAIGQGVDGGTGTIRYVEVWESEKDLPAEIIATMRAKKREHEEKSFIAAKEAASRLKHMLVGLTGEHRAEILGSLDSI